MIYQKLYETAIYPAYHWLMRDGANAAIRELDGNEFLDREALHQVTLVKLQRLLQHAKTTVPFYTERLRDIPAAVPPTEMMDTFQHVPLLSKATINQNLESMISTNL
ncbi:MAG: hypothetical protein GTO41_20525, partial [Burkholderiales bacterium]|nr:hypothetical protein [Burkholderiales bacterium]